MKVRLLNKDPMFDYRQFCKVTQGILLEENTLHPKDELRFWMKQFIACHSTLRCLHFRIIDNIPRTVAMQLVRHTDGHPQPEVESSRPDWKGKERSTDPYEKKLVAIDFTPESYIKMAQKRLCKRTEEKTRKVVQLWSAHLVIHPLPFFQALGMTSQPRCFWYGGCPELTPCNEDEYILIDRFLSKEAHI